MSKIDIPVTQLILAWIPWSSINFSIGALLLESTVEDTDANGVAHVSAEGVSGKKGIGLLRRDDLCVHRARREAW